MKLKFDSTFFTGVNPKVVYFAPVPVFKSNDRLYRSGGAPLGYLIHEALHQRITELADLAESESGRRPSKKEVLSALILDAPADGRKLNRKIETFHKASVSDAVISSRHTGNVISFEERKTGRPAGR